MRTITRIPQLSKQEYLQRGAIMKQYNAWLPAKIPDGLESSANPRVSKEIGKIDLDYAVSASVQHQVNISRGRDGKVICQFCTAGGLKPIAWCRHLKYLATHCLDAPLWTPMSEVEEMPVIVPIIPTEGIFAKLHLRRTKKLYANTTVILRPVNMLTETVDEHEIGYLPIDHGGIREMRSLLVDWVYGHLRDERYYYQEPINKSLEDAPDAIRINEKISPFTQRFHLALYGQSYGVAFLSPDDADLPTV